MPWRAVRQIGRRISWGIADQAVSSLTNFAVSIYIAHTLGAVQFGAFSIAYVTYAFALNASRGLSTDPLMIRFSAAELSVWRRAVARCTGTAVVMGLVSGTLSLGVAVVIHGATGSAFLALGLTLPVLLLQDSWRYSFFALEKGSRAFVNDLIYGVGLVAALLILRKSGHSDVFWAVLAWGGTAAIGAVIGLFQAGVIPRPDQAVKWIWRHRDLGPRYLVEGTSGSAANQLRTYGLGLILGISALGYVAASGTLMGPLTILFLGMSLATIPEAARILRRSPKHLLPFSLLISFGLALAALAWGVVLLVALPRGLGDKLLGPIWHGTYPLILAQTISVVGQAASVGPLVGLHALGAARRSVRTMITTSAFVLVCALAGAEADGAVGTVWAVAISGWATTLMWWWQLYAGLHDAGAAHRRLWFLPSRASGGRRGGNP